MENRVKVRIIGREYTLVTENSPEYTQELAQQLSDRMNDMLAQSKTLSGIDVAILCALDSMDERAKATYDADNIRLQLGEYMTSFDKDAQKLESAKREIASLKKQINELQLKLAQKK